MDLPNDKRHPQLLHPLYIRLLDLIFQQCSFPRDFTNWEEAAVEEEEFIKFREEVKELAEHCYCTLRSQYFMNLAGKLQSHPESWQVWMLLMTGYT